MGEPTGEATSNNQSLPTAEWLKIDSTVLSWIFMTLSKTLQQRLVFKDPQTAKETWDHIAKIFNDNKRTRSIALKAELLYLKLYDLSNDAYFCKIESIATILTSLGLPISNDDVVNIALEGFLDRYENVSSIIIHQDPFSDLKMVRSMLTTEDMWLNSRTILDPTLVGGGYSIPITNSGHSILTTSHRPLYVNNVLITPNIVKNLIPIHQFVRNNHCTIEFDGFGFYVKDFMIRKVLLRCDSTGDLYPVKRPLLFLKLFSPVIICGISVLDI
ncbi:hybrid signal transduction histidine kinase M [Tanacetum coccineum]